MLDYLLLSVVFLGTFATGVVLGGVGSAMTIRAIRQTAIGLGHANLTRDLPTRPSAFERLGTLKAEADPLADLEREVLLPSHGTSAPWAERGSGLGKSAQSSRHNLTRSVGRQFTLYPN